MVMPNDLSPAEFLIQCLNRTVLTDALSGLRRLPDKCIHTIVTSPPYWNLRDYGVPGQLGLEDTPEEFVHNMVLVFREARRVLRDDGTLWLNIGDSYAAKGKNRTPSQAVRYSHLIGGTGTQAVNLKQKTKIVSGLKPKDMVGIPWMLALALREDGWYLRQDVIWHKPNPMPESSQDRCTKAHEYVFMFAKSQRYYFDQKAIATKVAEKWPTKYAWGQAIDGSLNDVRKGDGQTVRKQKSDRKGYDYRATTTKTPDANLKNPETHNLIGDGMANKRSVWSIDDPMDVWRWLETQMPGDQFEILWDRYAREALDYSDVWKISTQAFRESHFATFPQELPTLCIKAATSRYGVCSCCGAPYERQTEKKLVPGPKAAKTFVVDDRDKNADKQDQASNRAKDGHKSGYHYEVKTKGWQRSCDCEDSQVSRPIVLDMFAGAGTTELTGENLGCYTIGFEINPEYIVINTNRRKNVNPLFHGIKH